MSDRGIVSLAAVSIATFETMDLMDINESLWQIVQKRQIECTGRFMEVFSREKILKVMAVTRFHFVAGMPTAGADVLSEILSQNPRFVARSNTQAEPLFSEMASQTQNPQSVVSKLDQDARHALLRGCLDTTYHARPLSSVVFDNNPAWMKHTYSLSKIMPLSRFIFMVRDPASIAADLARESGAAITPKSLMADDGEIGEPLRLLQTILAGPNAERVILIDRARFFVDPVSVLDVLYRFLREDPFEHDTSAIAPVAGDNAQIEPRRLRRIVSLASSAKRSHSSENPLPVWRRMRSSEAVMVLGQT